jgi:nitroreductase
MTQTFLSQLNWRFATKAFDPEKKVSEEDLVKILEAIRLAPTSAGLQPFHVFVITDQNVRKEMQQFSAGQSQVTDASHLLLFCVRSDVHERISAYIDVTENGTPFDSEKRTRTEERMKKMMGTRSSRDLTEWAARQTYLAMGFGLAACAELGIDSCPMEGFDAPEIDKLLELPPYMHSVAYVTIGYRKDDPTKEKVRFPQEDLFTRK